MVYKIIYPDYLIDQGNILELVQSWENTKQFLNKLKSLILVKT